MDTCAELVEQRYRHVRELQSNLHGMGKLRTSHFHNQHRKLQKRPSSSELSEIQRYTPQTASVILEALIIALGPDIRIKGTAERLLKNSQDDTRARKSRYLSMSLPHDREVAHQRSQSTSRQQVSQ